MSYGILEKFKEILGQNPVFSLRMASAPLFFCVPWNIKEHPLHVLCIAKGREALFAFDEAKYFAIATDTFRAYWEGKVSLDQLERLYAEYEKHARELYDEVASKDFSKLTDAELQEYTRNVHSLYLKLLDTLYIETLDYDKILSVVGAEYKERLDAIWEQATQSTFVSFEGRYLHDLVDLVSSSSSNIVRKAKFIFTDYCWSKSDSEIADALKEVQNTLEQKKREAEHVYATALKQKTEHTVWKETLDPELRKIVAYMQLVMRLRDVRKDPIAQTLAILTDIAPLMLERAGVDRRAARFVLLREYMKGTEYLKDMRHDIETREKGCIYLAYPDASFSYESEHCDFSDTLAQFETWTKAHHDSNELKGQIACRGLVRGIARVVFDPNDDKGFQKGDILVTSMTRPEFVPIMKRAGAVVTNEGGITCHAAIVSRELGIPCIIGTKIATQVLKDGDLVEVDADNGVVRILEK